MDQHLAQATKWIAAREEQRVTSVRRERVHATNVGRMVHQSRDIRQRVRCVARSQLNAGRTRVHVASGPPVDATGLFECVRSGVLRRCRFCTCRTVIRNMERDVTRGRSRA